MSETIFSKIIRKEIPASIVYEDDLVLAFRDSDSDQDLLGHLLLTVKKVAAEAKLSQGYRVVINNGEHGGQTVDHLHVHLLGDRPMDWPPG